MSWVILGNKVHYTHTPLACRHDDVVSQTTSQVVNASHSLKSQQFAQSKITALYMRIHMMMIHMRKITRTMYFYI